MFVKNLSMYEFKCFEKTTLDLQYPGRKGEGTSEIANINLILGDNGGGKSSTLRAIAIAVLAPALMESGFVPYRLVRRMKTGRAKKPTLLKIKGQPTGVEARRGEKNLELLARLEIRDRGSLDRLHTESTPSSPIERLIHDDYSSSFFVVGYGATRRVETGDYSEGSSRKTRGLRYQRVSSLFEDHVALRPLQTWLRRVKSPRLRSEAIKIISDLLPENILFKGRFSDADEQYLFDFEGNPTPFAALSDGYKAFIAWTGDLIGHLCDICPPRATLRSLTGVVLVDEIDLHLHPSWQRSVVPTLSKAFPHLQFVMTSHSPLIASTVRKVNIFVTDKDENGAATIKQIDERVFGQSSEQILLSSYFGLSTTRAESFQDEANVLFERAAKGDQKATLEYLKELTKPSAIEAKPRRKVGTPKQRQSTKGRPVRKTARK